MFLLLLVLIPALACLAFDLPAFEVVFACLIFTPVYSFLIGKVVALSSVVYLGIFAALLILFMVLSRRKPSAPFAKLLDLEGYPFLVFSGAFIILYQLCLIWPDFIAMGERLRDYSILSAVIKNPMSPQEPWMSGSGLFYYIFWYRFGAMLSSVLSLPVWEVYHLLVAFSLAFYIATAFRIFQKFFGFSLLNAVFSALLVGAGSNIAGVIDFFSKSDNWWGPSRVIPGAINEFPAWSFLLGDMHPHYLNLALIPFCISILLGTASQGNKIVLKLPTERIVLYLALLILPPIWLSNSNAWEIPIWAGLVACYFLLTLLSSRGRIFVLWKRTFPAWRSILSWKNLLLILLLLLAVYSLRVSTPLMPASEGTPLRFVKQPIAKSGTFDLLRHWGFPLFLIAISSVALIQNLILKILGAVFLLAALLYDDAAVFLYLLLMLNCLRVADKFGFEARKPKHLDLFTTVIEAIGLGAIALVILPEIVFLDDPYGGENERMNTIFKIYTTDWFLLHAFAFWLFSEALRVIGFKDLRAAPLYVAQAVIAVSFLGFFYHTINLRKNPPASVLPASEGLSEVERRFPGSSYIIKELRNLPEGITLEAQGNAYDYTSFVSTLSGKQSFLGWANHVNLLTKNYGEVSRREKLTEQFYRSPDCATKLKIMQDEKIRYAVFGTLEKTRYAGASNDFSCLRSALQQKDYSVFSLP